MRSESRKDQSTESGALIAKHRFIFIGICVALMAAMVYIMGESLQESQREASLDAPATGEVASIPVEAGVFRRSSQALSYLQTPGKGQTTRRLNEFYELRAYPGAPPAIPHPLESEQGIGGKVCLQCHENGGFVPKYNAYAPVVPHPELISCRQCHVAMKSPGKFKISEWEKAAAPKIRQAALPGSPPPIPHGMQMRENCLACHAGPGAVKEIQVTHPERVNCRQCHALVQANVEWQR